MADYKPSWNNFVPQDFMDDDSVDALVGGDEEALRQYIYQNRRLNERDDGSEELMRLVANNKIEDAVRSIQRPKEDPSSYFGTGGAMDRGGIPELLNSMGMDIYDSVTNPRETLINHWSDMYRGAKDYISESPKLAYVMGGEEAGNEAKRKMNTSKPASAAEFQKRQIEALLSDLDKSDGPIAPNDYHITEDFEEAKKKFRDGSGGTFSRTHFRTPLTKAKEDAIIAADTEERTANRDAQNAARISQIKGLADIAKSGQDPKDIKKLMEDYLANTDAMLPGLDAEETQGITSGRTSEQREQLSKNMGTKEPTESKGMGGKTEAALAALAGGILYARFGKKIPFKDMLPKMRQAAELGDKKAKQFLLDYHPESLGPNFVLGKGSVVQKSRPGIVAKAKEMHRATDKANFKELKAEGIAELQRRAREGKLTRADLEEMLGPDWNKNK